MKNLKTRLNRIEGQVRGISKMLDDNRDCIEILNQLSSIQSAIKGVWLEVVRFHLSHCITDDLESKNELIEELIEHINKIK